MSEQFDLLRAQRAVWESALPTVEKVVLLALLDHWSRQESQPFPSIERLRRWTSLGRTAVIGATKSLRARGVLQLAEPTQYGKPNRYDLSRVCSGVLPVRVTDRSVTRTSPPGEPHQSAWRTTPVRLAAPKEPKKEPKKEPTSSPPTRLRAKAAPNLSNAEGKTPVAGAHELKTHYVAEFERTRGAAPAFGKDWSRAVKAFGEIVTRHTLEVGRAVVTNCLNADPTYNRRINPWEIAADSNKWLKPPPHQSGNGRRNGFSPQQGTMPGVDPDDWGREAGELLMAGGAP